MVANRTSLEAQIAGRLLPLARVWRKLADEALEGQGLSAATAWVLTHLGRIGPDVRLTDLAEATEIAAPSLVRLLDQLVEQGLVTRTLDDQDRRSKKLALTARARPIVAESERSLAALRHRILGEFDDATLAATAAVLDRMSAAASAASAK
ncbi:MarR family transcriptional regulator [Sphingomonas populi]|uniref:MarR family transcriptional regulator n=1 Tax=Sphingomonas populi TaxID=2484750 RepID=A0A4Q6XWA4_9SPHN|nr:MarR family transcriptional regulator [Sphingomonas populi]RZF61239.1 MarR family transcriptional regulator [Sphingomonas populi]